MRSRAFVLPAATALVLLSGCGDSDVTVEPASEAPTTAVADVAVADIQEQKPSGPYDLVPRSVRAWPHDGGTRVVVAFDGEGGPGWVARYVDQAVLEGSGDVVDLDGDSILRLDVTGTPTLPFDDVRRTRTKVGGDVVDLHTVGAWEGVAQVFVGLDGRPTFEVSSRRTPSRIVIDLR
ncbi:hypothetical protein ABFT23_19995 [Nocardioides sp. C4-1]|uniref:AMIN-like domain-containing (lipo)protein n=1 Tax=Nocardioides sp. C4-1 TaxID=3151851 RepID=UPI0032630653